MRVRLPASPWPCRFSLAVGLLLTAGCDSLFVEPQTSIDPTLQLSLQMSEGAAASAAVVVDGLALRITRPDGFARDTAFGIRADSARLIARLILHPGEMIAGLRIDVDLFRESSRLYTGRADVDARGPSPPVAVVVMDPLVSQLTVVTASLSFDALNDTSRLVATARFVTGDTVPDLAPVWSSDAPSVASVTQGGLVTALGNGRALLTASVGDLSATVSVEVEQRLTIITAVTPASATLEVGEPLQFGVEGTDRLGSAIAGPVEATWISSSRSTLVVTRRGLVLGLAPGVVTLSVSDGGAAHSVPITVKAALGADVRPIAAAINRSIRLIDWSGTWDRVAAPSAPAEMATWSPAHDRVAYVQERKLWGWSPSEGLHQIDLGSLRRVAWPEYSADGQWIFFEAAPTADGPTTIYRVRPDGSGLERWPTAEDWAGMPTSSPDGRSVAYVLRTDLRVAPRDGAPYTLYAFDPAYSIIYTPTWSPDGSRIVLTYSPKRGVAIVRMDGSATFPLGSHGLWEGISWSPDGSWILGAEGLATLVSPDTGESFDLPWSLPQSGIAWWR